MLYPKILLVVVFLFSNFAFARPEYAARHSYTSCMVCHVNASGGGPKNVNGKLYGTHTNEAGNTAKNDYYSGDMRALGYWQEKAPTAKSGVSLMEAIAAANVPISTNSKDGSEIRGVAGYNLGMLSSGPRDIYVTWRRPDAHTIWPNNIQFGRFNAPFGLGTDEHRTYTRAITKTTFNDYEMGLLISGDPLLHLHYDFALTSGFQAGGAFANKDLTWAGIGNLRFDPMILPIIIGGSASYHQTVNARYWDGQPYAFSLNGILSIDRLTRGWVRGSILAEQVLVRGWNDPNRNAWMNGFLPTDDAIYKDAVKASQAVGTYVLVNWDVFEALTLQGKFDSFTPDRRFMNDSFYRYGVGFRLNINSNIQISPRVEKGFAKRPGIEDSKVMYSQDAAFVVAYFWL